MFHTFEHVTHHLFVQSSWKQRQYTEQSGFMCMHADLLCLGCRAYTASSGGSRGGSMELPFCMKGCICVQVCANVTAYTRTGDTQKPHWSFTVAITHTFFPPLLAAALRSGATPINCALRVIQLLLFHPKTAPETIAEGLKSKIFLGEGGGHQVHTGIPLSKS